MVKTNSQQCEDVDNQNEDDNFDNFERSNLWYHDNNEVDDRDEANSAH